MSYDVAAVRAQFPALAEGAAHFDGPGGSQTPRIVAEAVAGAMTAALANRGTVTPAERRADRIVLDARQAVADLVGAEPGGVVFGRSMTALTFDLARTLAAGWGPGDEVVVTSLDHDANIRPWVVAAKRVGATVRWAEFDPATGELDAGVVAELVGERTRLVAVTGASNLIGTRPAVARIAALAHDVGALVHVDGVHLTAHAPVDVTELGADFYACSPYKFCGPHLGALVARPALLETLRPDKLLPSSDAVPERFELGTLPYELLAGTTAAVDFLAGLAPGAGTAQGEGQIQGGSWVPGESLTPGEGPVPGRRDGIPSDRRTRVLAAMAAVEEHEDRLRRRIEDGLGSVPGVRTYSHAAHRTPTLLFDVEGLASADLSRRLAEVGVNAPASHFYALEASRRLGLGDAGAVRVGVAPYTDDADVDRLLEGLRAAVTSPR